MAIGSIVYAANLTQSQKDACANAENVPVTTPPSSPGGDVGPVAHGQDDCCENMCTWANGNLTATAILACEQDCER